MDFKRFKLDLGNDIYDSISGEYINCLQASELLGREVKYSIDTLDKIKLCRDLNNEIKG